jgi:hypothetical protein
MAILILLLTVKDKYALYCERQYGHDQMSETELAARRSEEGEVEKIIQPLRLHRAHDFHANEDKDPVLTTVTEIRMAIAILKAYRVKLERSPDEDWLFKNEIYETFNFHPQTLSDFLEKLSRRGLVRWIWTLPNSTPGRRRKLGGPAFKPTTQGQILLGARLKSMFDKLKDLFG